MIGLGLHIGGWTAVAPADAGLRGTAGGAALAAGALAARRPIGGTAAGSALASGALGGTASLGGTAAGLAAAAGAVLRRVPLGGTAAGLAAAAGALLRRVPLDGTAAGSALASGALGLPGALGGAAAGLAVVAGAMLRRVPLGGTAAGSALASGSLGLPGSLGGAAAGLVVAAGAMLRRVPLGGAAAGLAVAAGSVLRRVPLGGAAAGVGTTSGALAVNTPPSAQSVALAFVVPVGDTTAPALVSASPAAGATGVPRDATFLLTFSEPVLFGGGLIVLRNVTDGVDVESFDVVTETGTGPGQVAISGDVLTIRPGAALPAGKTLAVRIAAAAVTDVAGNAFAGIADDTTLSFATVPGGSIALVGPGSAAQTVNGTVHTFSGFSPVPTGVTILAGIVSTVGHPTGVTVAGLGATLVQSNQSANGWYASIWAVANAGGSGQDVVVTHAAATNRVAVVLAEAAGLTVAGQGGVVPAFSAQTASLGLATQAGDRVFLLARLDYTATPATTWTGAAEAVDYIHVSTVGTVAAAIQNTAAGGAPETFTFASSGVANPDLVLIGAVLR